MGENISEVGSSFGKYVSLLEAVRRGDIDFIKTENLSSETINSLLITASWAGESEITKYFLSMLKKPQKAVDTALRYALLGGNPECALLLVKDNPNIRMSRIEHIKGLIKLALETETYALIGSVWQYYVLISIPEARKKIHELEQLEADCLLADFDVKLSEFNKSISNILAEFRSDKFSCSVVNSYFAYRNLMIKVRGFSSIN